MSVLFLHYSTLFTSLYFNFKENLDEATVDIPVSWVDLIEISEKGYLNLSFLFLLLLLYQKINLKLKTALNTFTIHTNQLTTIIFFLVIVDFETRCPQGKKTIFYKRAKLEKFSEYLNKDGLVSRISVARDNDREFHTYIIDVI